MIDASGKLADGMLSGYFWFTGSPDACVTVDTKGPPSNDTAPFKYHIPNIILAWKFNNKIYCRGKYVLVQFGGENDFPEEEEDENTEIKSNNWKHNTRMPIFLPGPYLGIAGGSLVS